MRHEKWAVFQITNNEGVARLIIVRGATFREGARLETELQESYGMCFHTSFLGRFDQIETTTHPSGLFDLLFQESTSFLTLPDPNISSRST
jgi:hypothetical protein